jgi:hypothetical protein
MSEFMSGLFTGLSSKIIIYKFEDNRLENKKVTAKSGKNMQNLDILP